MPIKTPTPSKAEIDELRNLFIEKYEKTPPKEPFHPVDLSRVKDDDTWCRLFLEMYDLDMKVCLEKLWETCIWRKEFGANDLNENNVVKEYLLDGVVFTHNRDVDGKPLLIFKTKLHTKGVKNMDEVMRVVVYWIERIHRETNMDKITLFFDMAGTGLGNMDLDFVKRIIETFKMYYPNALNYILIYEMAWVLNAAFKIIKSLLPAKALEILKIISKKDINTYVDKENCLACWGGTDTYEFAFVPEQPAKKPTANGTTPVEGNTDLQNGLDKKVHFGAVTSRPYAESEMPECERGYSPKDTTDTMLRVSPTDNIFFNRGENSESVLELTCTSNYPITYKIQTTAPEKFRVRPRCGYMTPGESISVSIVLKQDYVLAEVTRDKFLVMCMAAPPGVDGSLQHMCDAWKQKPTNSPDVEQHRLTCAYRGATSGNIPTPGGSEQKYASGLGTPSVQSSAPKSTNTMPEAVSVSHLSSQAKMLESQLKFTQILQCITLFFLLALSVAVVYLLKMQLSSGRSPCEAAHSSCHTCSAAAAGGIP